MKNLIPLLILSLALTFCGQHKDQSETAQKQMIVYGSNECEHCIAFKKKMDSLNIKYTFYDVHADEAKANEMLKKLEEVNFMGYIAFPVVDVEGDVMVNPELQKVISAVRK